MDPTDGALPRNALAAVAAHRFKRQRHEHYVDEQWCSERLFAVEVFSGPVWDPSCGWGRIVEWAKVRGHEAIGTDLVDRGYGTGGVDFLRTTKMRRGSRSIVCNPPFDLFREFTEHAISLGAEKVAMIALWRRLPAATWLADLPLVRVRMMNPRPSMPTGSFVRRAERGERDPKTGKRLKVGGGTQDFCWLVFAAGEPRCDCLSWLRRNP